MITLDRIRAVLASLTVTNAAQEQTANLLQNVIFILIGMMVFALPVPFFTDQVAVGLVLLLLLLSLNIAAFFLLRRGYIQLTALFLTLTMWVAITLIHFFLGGINSPVFSAYFVIILLAGMVLNDRIAILLTVLSLLAGVGLVLIEYQGWLPPPIQEPGSLARWLTQVVNFIAVSSLVLVASRKLTQALRQAQEKERILTNTIQEATQALTSALNLDETLEWILILFQGVVPYDSACLFLIRDERLEAVAGRGFADPSQVVGKSYSLEDQFLIELEVNKDPIYLADAQKDPRFNQWGGTDYIRGWMAVPILIQGEVIGYLTVDSRQPDVYHEAEADLAEAFAAQVAVAIENARLFTETHRRAQQLASLNELARQMTGLVSMQDLCMLVAQRLYLDYGDFNVTIFTVKGEMGQIVIASMAGAYSELRLGSELAAYPGQEWVRQVVDQGEPLLQTADVDPRLTETRGGLLTRLFLPLLVGQQVIGVLNIDSNGPVAFDDNDLSMLTLLSDQLAMAMERTRLFDEITQRAEELQAASNILRSLNGTPNVQIAFPAVSRGIQMISGCARVSVALLNEESDLFTIMALEQPVEVLAQGTAVPTAETAITPDILQGDVHLTPDLGQEQDRPAEQRMYEAGYRSRLNLPLFAEQRIMGSLNLSWQEPNAYNEEQLPVLTQIADALALAIVRSQTLEALQLEIEERRQLEKQIQGSLTRRARQVQTSTEVAQQIARATVLDELFDLVVELVQERFAYYHAQVYVLQDDTLFLRAGTGEAGQKMMAGQHSLPLQAPKGLVTRAAREGQPILVADVSQADDWLPNRYLPETESELAVPIKLGEQTLGVLDIQSDQLHGLTEEDQILLTGLCGQIAVAINNRRLQNEQKEAADALRAYTRELERSNRELQDFAYVASHDLQEPLRKIQAFGDRLKLKYADVLDERGQDYLSRMQRASARMQTLISDLLSFSRVTTRAKPFVEVDLNKIVRGVLSDLEIRLEEVEGQVDVGDLPALEADPLQMRQLLQNLIGNGLKFNRPGVPPHLRVESESQIIETEEDKTGKLFYRLLIIDNGIGFEEKYTDRIFGIFQRLHGRGVYEGTGMGLAICRKIVERHNGIIKASSQPGEGTTFEVLLPAKQSKGAADYV